MSPLLFRNIAGRCGRAGKHTEGDTIIFDNPVGDPQFTFAPNRTVVQIQTFFEDTHIEIQSVFEEAALGSQFRDDLVETMASQFLAAVPENPAEDDLPSAFTQALYWPTDTSQAPRARSTIRSLADSILDDSKGALAVAASPFRLTDFGSAAVRSGFAPSSCRAILEFVSENERPSTIHELIGQMIVDLGYLPEQPNGKWRKEVEKPSRSCRV
jgi:helicase